MESTGAGLLLAEVDIQRLHGRGLLRCLGVWLLVGGDWQMV